MVALPVQVLLIDFENNAYLIECIKENGVGSIIFVNSKFYNSENFREFNLLTKIFLYNVQTVKEV
ncbi:hypothetical protein BpHYR1_036315 [Brachionus plicatilis]|uniref:Uncharacterized protein n=1 Tax=Brachionus plicatilis TaxID=10195 RepID=A0A3M7SM34_BRAPC|nr:hypothetical protein BpHYR1_036315 [Brachionus plicatilis]